MSDRVNRFLGDTPGRTLVKLLVVSLIVGFIMTVFGIYPARHRRWRPPLLPRTLVQGLLGAWPGR